MVLRNKLEIWLSSGPNIMSLMPGYEIWHRMCNVVKLVCQVSYQVLQYVYPLVVSLMPTAKDHYTAIWWLVMVCWPLVVTSNFSTADSVLYRWAVSTPLSCFLTVPYVTGHPLGTGILLLIIWHNYVRQLNRHLSMKYCHCLLKSRNCNSYCTEKD